MMNFLKRLTHRLFDVPCVECQEVRVPVWTRRCGFCDKDEGLVK